MRKRRRPPTEEQVHAARLRLAALARPRGSGRQRTGWIPQIPADLAASQEPPPVDGSAVLDRMPLRLRAAVESLPDGIRGGRLGLEGGHAVVVVLLVLLALAVAALLLGLGRPRVEPVGSAVSASVIVTGTPASGVAGQDDHTDADRGPAQLVIHVAGLVHTPGVVRLARGARVLDALEAAGGARDGVDLTNLNLARPVTDGEQVLVGVTPPAGAATTPGTGDTGSALVNLNTATTEQLEALPGIGPALAGRILAWREDHGRFTSVDELQEVSGIGPARFAELADLVTV
jgi:competence protein ComEA